MDRKTLDRVERLVGLEFDGRLDDASRRELDALLEDRAAARVREEMLGVRALLREAGDVPVPPLLRDRIVARVAVARDEALAVPPRTLARNSTLRLVQTITLAAAVTLGVTAWITSGGAVRADDRLDHPRTVEDDLRERSGADGSLVPYLEWRFLGAEK